MISDLPPAPPGDPITVRIPEAVRLTGLSRSRIYELMGSGEIEFAKVGSSTLILVDSLRARSRPARRRWLRGGRRPAGPKRLNRSGPIVNPAVSALRS